MRVKPIPVFDAYFTVENAINGLTKDSLEHSPVVITDIDDEPVSVETFFRIGKTFYFSVNSGEETMYFSQTNGTVTEIEQSDFPEKPEQTHVEYSGTNFDIIKNEWNNIPVSDICNKYTPCGNPRFIQISGVLEGKEMILFLVTNSGRPGLSEGLYFMRKNESSPSQIFICNGYFC